MAHLRMEVWALPLTGEARPLPDLESWEVAPTDGDDGSVQISYPANGRNADLFEPLLDDELDTDIEVELTLTAPDGRTWTDRAILDEADVDEINDQPVITASGRLLSAIFREVVLPYHPSGENGETPVSGTAGYIVRTLVEAAQGRGCLAGVSLDFTDTEDSAGQPWTNTGNFRLSPGQNYGAMLGMVRGYQLGEHRLLSDRTMQLFNPDGKGTDRTTGGNPLTFEHGRDLGDGPRKRRLRDVITSLLSSGKDGLYDSADDPVAQSRLGRRKEGYYSFGNTDDPGTLAALTEGRLATQTRGKTEVSHKLVLGPGRPLPLIDFFESDYVFSSTRRGLARRRIVKVVVAGDKGEATSAVVTVGVLLEKWIVAQQRRLDDLASGAAVVGTSNPPPEVDDGSTPAAPAGGSVVATSLWYSTGEGVGMASVTAAWTAVPDSTVAGYVAEWRYTGGGYATGWQRRPQVDGTSATWSGVAAGAPVEVRVYAVNRWGRYSPASSPVYAFVTELDATPPAVPSTPAPYSSLGLLVVPWNGTGVSNAPMPQDFLRVEVHRSTTSGFTPHRPLLTGGALDERNSTTYVGEMRGRGELPVDGGVYGTTYYIRLVAVDRSHNASAPSAQGSVVLAQVADGEIAELGVGKLRTGIMTALMTISGTLTTRSGGTGAGWTGDTAGFRFYNSLNQTIFEFVASTAQLLITGTVQTGRTGRRAVLSGAGNDLRFYPQVGETRYARLFSYVPTNYPNDIALELRSIDSDGATDKLARLSLLPDIVSVAVHEMNDEVNPRARILANDAGVAIEVLDGNGLANSNRDGGYLGLGRGGSSVTELGNSEGDVWIDAADELILEGATVRSTVAMGNTNGFSMRAQFGAAAGIRAYYRSSDNTLCFVDNQGGGGYMNLGGPTGAYKTFVIPHPTDPARWLVHAAVEGPEAAVVYRGTVELVAGRGEVQLPAYFEAATRAEGRTVHLTVVADQAMVTIPTVAATPIRGGRFEVLAQLPLTGRLRVSWLVHAVRADGPPLVVEPLRSDVQVRGAGTPYTWVGPPMEPPEPPDPPEPPARRPASPDREDR